MHEIEKKKMIQMAKDVRLRAYSPYSNFAVGACVKGESGAYYCGCNVENAAYGNSICAERSAILHAVSESERKIVAVAVVADCEKPVSPCGSCRQFMVEFADDDCLVITTNLQGVIKEYNLGELIKDSFRKTYLGE